MVLQFTRMGSDFHLRMKTFGKIPKPHDDDVFFKRVALCIEKVVTF